MRKTKRVSAKSIMPLGSLCFWCNCELDLTSVTKEHIVPTLVVRRHYHPKYNLRWRHLSADGNLTFACRACNQARGMIQSVPDFSRVAFEKDCDRTRRRWLKKRDDVVLGFYHWLTLEREKLGWSPMLLLDWFYVSKLIDFDLVEGLAN